MSSSWISRIGFNLANIRTNSTGLRDISQEKFVDGCIVRNTMVTTGYPKKNSHTKAAIAFQAGLDHIGEAYPEIAAAIVKELKDQRSMLKMIASENYSSLATQLAMGNWLTDKYSEGYAHHRFYAGCDNVDTVEDAAVGELKKLFGCDHAYVQPHSGADANIIAFWAILVHRIQSREVDRLGKKSVD